MTAIDALFIFKHSQANDEELRFALRALAANMPWVRKAWVFGDRPRFLASDRERIEHIPHEYIARIGRFRTPVRNTFTMLFLASLLPELSPEFLMFTDDAVVLEPTSLELASVTRFHEDFQEIKTQGKGLWNESLWRTLSTIKRLGLPTRNYEVHVPTRLTKRQVLEAYLDLRDFTSEDRFYGLLAQSAILNHASKTAPIEAVRLVAEKSYAGFHNRKFNYDEIKAGVQGKRFLNYDDIAFDENMQRFLSERFPDPCCYERPEIAESPFSEDLFWPPGKNGPAPDWPRQPGRRIAVFLQQSSALSVLIKQLLRLPAASIVICPNVEPGLLRQCEGSRVRVIRDNPPALAQLAAECDLAVGNASVQFSRAIAYSRKPQLLLPLNDTQRELARSFEQQSAAVVANPLAPMDIISKLRSIWDSLSDRPLG